MRRMPRRAASNSTLSLCCLRALSLASSPARSSYATSSDAWPPMLHDCVPQRLSSRRQEAGACSLIVAGIPSVLRPLARGAVDGSSGKLGRRRDVRALVRRSRHTAALGEPAAPSCCAIKGAAQLGRARRGASGSALLTRHAIGQRITGGRFAGAAPSGSHAPSARWRSSPRRGHGTRAERHEGRC